MNQERRKAGKNGGLLKRILVTSAFIVLTSAFALAGHVIEAPEIYGHPADDPGCDLIWQRHHPDTGTQWPIVLMMHGGGFSQNRYSSDHLMQDAANELADHGYQAICIDFRNDEQFITGQTTPGTYHQQTDDVKMAILAARALPSFNGTKVFGVGGSTGGHHAYFCCGTGTLGADRFDGAVDQSGAHDFTDRTADPNLAAFVGKVQAYCGVTDDSPPNMAIMLADSPVTLIDAAITPLFLAHSPNDDMPPIQQTLGVNRLIALGVTNYQQVTTSGNAHAFENWPLIHTSAIAFLDAVLADEPPPPPMGVAFIKIIRK